MATTTAKKTNNQEEEYKVVYKTYNSTREHIIDRPEAYGGSKQLAPRNVRLLDEGVITGASIMSTRISCRVFEELINNLTDAATRAREKGLPIGKQKVFLSPQRIRVYNESAYIPIVQTTTEYIDEEGNTKKRTEWDPFRCFGRLLTSSNYNDDEDRITAGVNGYGGHLAPIESTRFDLDCLDPQRKLKYEQTWRDNGGIVEPPTITKHTDFPLSEDGRKCGAVSVTFVISKKSSGVSEYSPDVLKYFRKLIADASFTSNLPFDVIEYQSGNEDGWEGEGVETVYDYRGQNYFPLYSKLQDRSTATFDYKSSKVFFFDTPGSSFDDAWVNGSNTFQGVHVRVWRQYFYRILHNILSEKEEAKEILQQIAQAKAKKNTKTTKTTKNKKNSNEMTDKGLEKLYGPHISLLLICTLIKPSFASQTKEELIAPTPETPALTGKNAITPTHSSESGFASWRIFDEVINSLKAKLKRKAIKDGGKKTEFVDVPEAEDAEWAGTKNSDKCALILCEGKSGVTIATKGAQNLNPKAYGIMPTKGKPANLMQHPNQSAELVKNLTKLLGWAPGKTRKDLRYNRILIMTDADPDGIHIRLLLILLVYVAFPGLLQEGFVDAFIYPIVTVTRRNQTTAFYSMNAFDQWCRDNNNGQGYKIKYFKGLGSCEDADIKYAFAHPVIVKYNFDAQALNKLELAFHRDKTNQRKQWLLDFDPNEIFVYPNTLDVSMSVLKELPIFSIYETERAISNMMDGLNLGQRKVIHIVRKNNIMSDNNRIKVKQLAGQVANEAAYHHNEDILMDTITHMNRTVTGTNNIPLLTRKGELGSRRANGEDAASGRYTYTFGSKLLDTLYTKDDDAILEWLQDGTDKIEPKYFYATIALVLANAQCGIGCGSNSKSACFAPKQLIAMHKYACQVAKSERLGEALVGTQFPPLLPWARYFRGQITVEKDKVICRGVFTQKGSIIHVTEVPLGTSYNDYVAQLNIMKATNLDDAKAGRGTDAATKKKIKATAKADLKKELAAGRKGKAKKPKVEKAPKTTKANKGKEHAKDNDDNEEDNQENNEEDNQENNEEDNQENNTKTTKKKAVKLLKSHTHEAYLLRENGDDHCHFELREFGLLPTHKNLKLETTISMTQLTFFDEKNKLRKFDTPEALLDHYHRVMLESREVMRQRRIESCTDKVAELELKVQFVAEVIKNPLLVAGREDEPLQAWMTERGYPDAFLSIPLRSITAALQERISKQLEDERSWLEYYNNIGCDELWLQQIEAFEKAYNKMYSV